MSRGPALVTVAVFVAVALGGCAAPPPAPLPDDVTSFVSLVSGAPDSLDPASDYEGHGIHVIQNVYEPLFSYLYYRGIVTTQVQPLLAAELPTYDESRTELTVRLRPAVLFHDGTSLDAHDVQFSLDRIVLMRSAGGPWGLYDVFHGASEYFASNGTEEDREAYRAAGAVTVVDSLTLRIRLAYPDPAILPRLAFSGASVLSRDWVCAHADASWVRCLPPTGERDPTVDRSMLGTGPFRLASWERAEDAGGVERSEVVLERFAGYWGPVPRLDRVVIRAEPSEDERVRALRAGEVDDAHVPVDRAGDVVGKRGLRVVEDLSLSVAFAGFNQRLCGPPGAGAFDACMADHADLVPRGGDGRPAPEFFADPHMRQAWVHAFDYARYERDVLGGRGRMLNGLLPEGIFGHDPAARPATQDVVAARLHLALSGNPTGFEATVLYSLGSGVPQRAAELLAENVEALGPNIRVETRGVELQRLVGLLVEGAAPVVFLGWLPDYAFPDNYLIPFAHPGRGILAQSLGVDDASLERRLEALVRETDPETLRIGYREAAQRLTANATYLWLEQVGILHVEREWVRGYVFNPMSAGSPNVGYYATISKE